MPETFEKVRVESPHGNFNPRTGVWEMIDGKRAILGEDIICTVICKPAEQIIKLILDEGGEIIVTPEDLASFGNFGNGAFEIRIKGNINKKLRITGLDMFADKTLDYSTEEQ